jgi:uncharacterized protein (TIGR03790 family)
MIAASARVLALLFAFPAACIGAVTAADIVIVYNLNSPESREVAEYYATRRNVPGGNLTGIDVPDAESISREMFDKRVSPPVRAAASNLRKNGHAPVILLVYGTPLRMEESDEAGNGELKKIAQRKAGELSPLVRELSLRLEDLDGATGQGGASDVPAIISRAEKAVVASNRLLSGAGANLEAGSIVYRLVGPANIARYMIQQAGKKADELKDDNLVKLALALQAEMDASSFRGGTLENAQNRASAARAGYGLLGELRFWHDLSNPIEIASMTSASLDSELSVALSGAHRTGGWLANPFNAQFDRNPGVAFAREDAVMAARLDGPTPEIAKRLVDDALWAEENGLDGKFYIDAKSEGKDDNYDARLRRLADMVREKGTRPVVMDSKEALFAPDCCPDAALYVGWYSLGKYVDSFGWKRGAVGFHIASAEAQTLRDKSSTVWCKRMLEEGMAATLGPVQEPYLQAFPPPDLFFPLLMSGKLTLVEAYYRSAPFMSWRMTLIGDPLYTPFLKKSSNSR